MRRRSGKPVRAAALICLDDGQKASLEPLGTDQAILLGSLGLKPVRLVLPALGDY